MPTVITAHDMIPWVVPGYKGSAFMQLYLALAAASAKRADLIIADSDASRRDVINVLRVPPQKVHTVYLGVEPAQAYTPEQLEDVRARFGLPPHFAFYIGGFDRRKNVPLLLRAWRKALDSMPQGAACDKPVLAIGGAVPEPGGVFPDVQAEASSLGLMSEQMAPVRFLGRITESDKPLLMAAAHVFVYPSAYEGFGLDPLEAMSVGSPVISSYGGSLREVVGDGGLLVSPNDEDELCRAIVRLWHDEGLRQRLSQSGRDRAKLFTWQRTAEQTQRLYSSALESAGKTT
jgi:glycosyltransferase involved in cell wall biosynthesis